jgi:hypothetical protein
MYYVELNNFTSDVLDFYPAEKLDSIKTNYFSIPLEFLKKQVIENLLQCGLEIEYAFIFKKMPRIAGAIHYDLLWDVSIKSYIPWESAININLTTRNSDSKMCWFRPNIPEAPPRLPNNIDVPIIVGMHYGTRNNNNYKYTSDFTFLDSIYITKPTLVKTSTPHLIENYGDEERVCLSLRFKGNPTIEECSKKLKNFI